MRANTGSFEENKGNSLYFWERGKKIKKNCKKILLIKKKLLYLR